LDLSKVELFQHKNLANSSTLRGVLLSTDYFEDFVRGRILPLRNRLLPAPHDSRNRLDYRVSVDAEVSYRGHGNLKMAADQDLILRDDLVDVT
jgi:hypothetical protein